MRVLSLFDGISCGRAALERACIAVEDYSAFEIDKYAIAVSRKNYPEIRHFGNVFKGDFKQFKGYDLLIGGSPCTYWSIAKRGRETEVGGSLWNMSAPFAKAARCGFYTRTITRYISRSRTRSAASLAFSR